MPFAGCTVTHADRTDRKNIWLFLAELKKKEYRDILFTEIGKFSLYSLAYIRECKSKPCISF